jgi:hypothetical protein
VRYDGVRMRERWYVLRGRRAVPVDDVLDAARALEDVDARQVGLDDLGAVQVSTVFLGLDHNWRDGPPLLFETMTFSDDVPALADRQDRYATWDEAVAGHARTVAVVRRYLRRFGRDRVEPV